MEATNATDLWPAAPALDTTFGAIQIGTYLGLILYGISIHQAYRYVRTYRMDCTLIKGFVGTMMVLETFHVILCMHVCYFYLATNYLHSDRLLRDVWSINLLPATTGSAIFVSQAFFARRVYLISPRYRLLVAAAIVLSFVELGFAIAATVESFRMPSFTQFWGVTWTVSAAFGAAVASDALLTGVLIYVLHSSRTAFGRTDSIIDGLITYSTNTGLLISVFNVLSLIFALILPDNLIYAGIMIVATNLYANSLLAVLNTRQVLADHAMDRFEPTSFRIEKASAHGRSRNSEAEQWHVPQLDRASPAVVGAIVITTTTETVHDSDSAKPAVDKFASVDTISEVSQISGQVDGVPTDV